MSAFLAKLHRRDAVLSLTGWAHLVLAALFVIGLWVDERLILGLNPWVKPLKFAISITIYVWTIAWLLGDIRASAPLAAKVVSAGTALALLAEIVCIALQSVRGVPSHFNVGAPFDARVFGIMGMMILLNSLLAAWLLWLYLTLPTGLPRPQLWGVRLGLVLFLAGSAVGPLMVSRSAHAVGVPDGGPGLPFVNWSTEGGDLRIAHALGLHALQILPVAGWGLARLGWLTESGRVAAVFGLAAGCGLLFGLALGLALGGRPVV